MKLRLHNHVYVSDTIHVPGLRMDKRVGFKAKTKRTKEFRISQETQFLFSPFGNESAERDWTFLPFTLELGLLSPNNFYWGIKGHVFYAGAVAVFYKEWQLAKPLYVSTGLEAGLMFQYFSERYLGGPQLRIGVGTKHFRFTVKSQIAITKEYERYYGYSSFSNYYDRYERKNEEEVKFRPSLSAIFQFNIMTGSKIKPRAYNAY